MSQDASILRRSLRVPDQPAALAVLMHPVLDELIGGEAAPVSLGFEYGVPVGAGDLVEIHARIVRATRTLVFAQASVRTGDGRLAADVSAVYRRENARERVTEGSG